MKITLQKLIGYFWLILATADFINFVNKNFLKIDTWRFYSNNFYSQPYFEQIFPSVLIPKISAASPNSETVTNLYWCFFSICSIVSVLIPIMLILNQKHSRKIAKVFLILFVLTNLLAISIRINMLSPFYPKYEIEGDMFVMKLIYYYSTISFISILMFVGLFYGKSKKQINLETISD